MHLESGLEPVFTLLAAFVAAVTATTLLVVTGGTRHVDADLVAHVGPAVMLGLGPAGGPRCGH